MNQNNAKSLESETNGKERKIDLDALRAQLLELAGKIAPEIELPIYVIWTHEILTDDAGSVFGTVGGDLPAAYRINLNEWRGAGWGIIIRTTDIQADAIGTFLHETAHIICGHALPPVESVKQTEGIKKEIGAQFTRRKAGVKSECYEYERVHGWRFWRCLLHLHYRAIKSGASVEYSNLGNAAPMMPGLIAESLRSDFRKNSERRFMEFLNEKPPKNFIEKWPYWARK